MHLQVRLDFIMEANTMSSGETADFETIRPKYKSRRENSQESRDWRERI